MKTYGTEVSAPWQALLNLTLDDHFPAEERAPGIPSVSGLVGPSAHLKNFTLSRLFYSP